ncbi:MULTISPECIES: hypothetical protein [unclassified Ensifer]|uniref:hypothetical protein n=1 Tax=unclassified Ensifer TaxID=2633371 RepID=UPI000813AAAA|nr:MULTISPECIES: hypothetical protein [unclassified Ensifer]OCP07973.1 hypothetical protein BC362_10205 [Ensifer sp. LC14]OCP10917.1 hypothetical protein BC374_17760 [Ensifer sp. LC13]OCP11538.1 hypothetical protein BBX50_18095 [Ensifer sp. LC11]OCP33356.1 hypothetical protein BC364_16985 [Ensifer sp. LC499]
MDFSKLEPLSQAKFAKIAGVSGKTVSDWKSKGYLTFTDDGLVDSAASAKVLHDRGLGKFETVTPPAATVTLAEPTEESDADTESQAANLMMQILDGQVEMELLTYKEAETYKENYLAMNARLKYEHSAGRLVEKAAVEKLFIERWSAERDAWEVWPSLVCGTLAAKFGIDQIQLRVALEDAVEAQLKDRVSRPTVKL